MDYHRVEGHNDLVRDPKTNSIINTNMADYQQYINRRSVKNEKNEKIQNIEEEVANMKSDIDEIKSMLRELLNGSR